MDGLDRAFEQYVRLETDRIADPYLLFDELRATQPVYWSEAIHGWVLTRYDECAAVLRDPHMSSNRHTDARSLVPEAARAETQALREQTSLMMGPSDPPKHTRLRALINKAFTPGMVQGMRPRIEQIANELLDRMQDVHEPDLIRDFAYPLPIIVIAEIIGVPAGDREQFKRWSSDWVSFIAAGTPTAEQARKAQSGMAAMAEYFNNIINDRRSAPTNDLLSALVAVEQEGSRLSEPELLAMCNSLLAGGHETTTNLIANGFLALLQNPEQLGLLRNAPDTLPLAVEELLRFDSPVQRVERFATREMKLNGRAIGCDERLWVMLGAANRDPARFSEPQKLDVRRTPNPHLAFALGIHFCVGAPLARLEGEIALATLIRRLQMPRLATHRLEWREMIGHRGLKQLPIAF